MYKTFFKKIKMPHNDSPVFTAEDEININTALDKVSLLFNFSKY